MNDDYGLFDSLLLISNLIACPPEKVDALHAGELLFFRGVSRGRQWELIRDLYAMSCTSDAGCNHSFRILILLLMVSMNSAVEYLDIYDGITHEFFTDPENDLSMLMDILWGTWKSLGAEHRFFSRKTG